MDKRTQGEQKSVLLVFDRRQLFRFFTTGTKKLLGRKLGIEKKKILVRLMGRNQIKGDGLNAKFNEVKYRIKRGVDIKKKEKKLKET